MLVLSKEIQELILHDGVKLRRALEEFRQHPMETSVSFQDHRGNYLTIERCRPDQAAPEGSIFLHEP